MSHTISADDLLAPAKRRKMEPRHFTREPTPQLEPGPALASENRNKGRKRTLEVQKEAVIEEPVEEEEEKQYDGQDTALPQAEDIDAILSLVDKAPEVPELNISELRQLVLRFEKAVNKNVEMRSKFPDKPEKFMDSEIALDESISALHALAAVPELYIVFVDAKAVPTLLSLISHENTDIGIAVIGLLVELLDGDTLAEETDEAIVLVEALVENNGLRVLTNALEKMDEKQKEDSTAVHNILTILENLVEVKTELSLFLVKETKALEWILTRLKKDVFDANKLYCSEILSVFLQTGGDQVKRAFGEKKGMTFVIRAVAKYRKMDPVDADETEFVENLFHTLCFAMNENPDNQILFARADGLTLMITMMKRKNYSKAGALKTLDFALNKCVPNCEKFVDGSGLKTLFATFMGKGVKKKYRKRNETNDEHIISIIAQLFMNLSDTRYLRLLKKFMENEYEKVERLIELHEKYYRRLEKAEKSFRLELKSRMEPKTKEEEDEEIYNRRLEAGLFTLQLVAFVLGFVGTCGDSKIKERILQLLNQKDQSFDNVKKTLQEYLEQMGNPKWGRKMKNVLESIVAML